MEDGAVIRCRLDLLVRLIDTTTGQAVTSQSVYFKKDNENLTGRPKGEGNYIFIGIGRENFSMQLNVLGYDSQVIEVDYEKLDEHMPSIDVFLIPSENTPSILTLSGTMRGLSKIEAVQLGKPVCSIKEFNSKDNSISLFLSNRQLNMEGRCYGLLHGEKSYERFWVTKQQAQGTAILAEPLQEEFAVNSPIAHVVTGCVDAKGGYILRIRDTANTLRYLVRFETAEGVKYRVYKFEDGKVIEEKD